MSMYFGILNASKTRDVLTAPCKAQGCTWAILRNVQPSWEWFSAVLVIDREWFIHSGLSGLEFLHAVAGHRMLACF